MLFAAYTALTVAMAAVAVAVALDAPSWLVFALVPFVNLAITVPRPAQAALLPSVVHTSEELTAANAGQSSLESASLIGAPLLVAVLISAGGLSLALAGMTLTALIAAVAAAPISGPLPFAADEGRDGDGGTAMRALRLVAADPPTRLLVLTLGSQFMLLGALDLLCVVLAVEALGIGESGAGYLNAAIGVGGVAALAVTARLVGARASRRRCWRGHSRRTIPLVLLAVHTTTASAVILLAIVGLGRCVFDVSGRTLLQRTAAPAALAGVFALLESMLNVGLAAGSLLVPLLIALGGADAALVGVAAALLLSLALAAPRLVRLDEAAHVPLVQMHVLRAITIFRALPAPALETLARSVEHAPVQAGTTRHAPGRGGRALLRDRVGRPVDPDRRRRDRRALAW